MPIFFDASKHRKLYFRFGVVLVFAAFLLCLAFLTFSIFFGQAQRPLLTYADVAESYHYYYSAANRQKVALTFNDGPRAGVSDEILDTLTKEGAPATFFFSGESALLEPSLVYKTGARGFDIGNNSFTESDSAHFSLGRLSFELRATDYVLSKITGETPRYYRPPYLLGIGIDPTMNPYIPLPQDILWTLQNGYVPVGADLDTRDWAATSSEAVMLGLENALQSSPSGHIVLLHELSHTSEALPQLIRMLRASGYTIVPLSELLSPPRSLSLTKTLRFGDTDATTNGEVSALQWFLYKDGKLDPYLITGFFGQQTRAALIKFQVDSRVINPDSYDAVNLGIAEARTRASISSHATATLAAAATVVPSSTFLELKHWVGDGLKGAYVNLFPVLRGTLSVMVRLALILVVLRFVILGILLLYGRFWKRKEAPVALDPMSERGISILVPAYNEEENIKAAVESVLRSRHAKKEVIVIDDGSTDTTAQIIRAYIAAHPGSPLSLISVENGGKASALNHGLRAARFEVCVVLDADAVIEPDTLSHFLKHFKDDTVGAVAGKVCTTGSRRMLDMFQKLEYAIGQNIDKRAFSGLELVGIVPGPAGAWSRKHVLAAGGFSTDTLVEDQDMTLTLLRSGLKVHYEKDAIAHTETPHTVPNFLKQRFRWVYGTMQCFWKHKRIYIEQPLSGMSLIVLPNILLFNIVLPLTYPFADLALLFGLILSDWHGLLEPFLLFTFIDLIYASFGVWQEQERWKLLGLTPFQRIAYRQLLSYSVFRSFVRAVEGTGSRWNKFAKVGETQRYYFSSLSAREELQAAAGIASASGRERASVLLSELNGPKT